MPMSAISQQIQNRVESWPSFQEAETVLFYSAFRNEVCLGSLTEKYPRKRWYLPKVEQPRPEQDKRLGFYRFSRQTKMFPGAYGVLEPASCERFIPSQDDPPFLIFVPGLLFDKRGYRLGYGKGYYDRFLQGLSQQGIPHISVGLVPDALCIDELPFEPHDIPVQWVVTESYLHAV